MNHRILPRFYRWQQQADSQRRVDRAVRESVGADSNTPTVCGATLPGDKRRLRGIPVAGGACGTSPGTDPLHETVYRLSRTLAPSDA